VAVLCRKWPSGCRLVAKWLSLSGHLQAVSLGQFSCRLVTRKLLSDRLLSLVAVLCRKWPSGCRLVAKWLSLSGHLQAVSLGQFSCRLVTRKLSQLSKSLVLTDHVASPLTILSLLVSSAVLLE
jgi:lambda repressor-like predicted transcriptional regulator